VGGKTAISFVRRALIIIIISGRPAMPLTPTEIIGNGRSPSEKRQVQPCPYFSNTFIIMAPLGKSAVR